MGTVISLQEYRQRRRPTAATQRLDRAVAQLDPLVRTHAGRLSPTIERELRAIAEAVASGSTQDAADRAERLIGILEHPAASG